MHIGLHYASPFQPTVAILREHDPDLFGERALHPDYLLLDAENTYITAAKAISCMALSDKWLMQLYTLEDSIRPVAKMLLGLLHGNELTHNIYSF